MKQSHFQNSQKKISDLIPGHHKVYVARAEVLGRGLGSGLFAKKNIERGEVVFIIKGKRIPLKISSNKESSLYPNAISIDRSVWLNPFPTNPLIYLNHSCEPNTGIKGSVSVVALRNIKKGEQVTIDYSITEWDDLWVMPGVCGCGSKGCRKKIRSIHSLPPNLYKRYLPYIPKFLQREYENKMKS